MFGFAKIKYQLTRLENLESKLATLEYNLSKLDCDIGEEIGDVALWHAKMLDNIKDIKARQHLTVTLTDQIKALSEYLGIQIERDGNCDPYVCRKKTDETE